MPITDWYVKRAEVFRVHCKAHNADFEVCDDPECKAVVAEEVRRGLLVIPDDGSMPQFREEAD